MITSQLIIEWYSEDGQRWRDYPDEVFNGTMAEAKDYIREVFSESTFIFAAVILDEYDSMVGGLSRAGSPQ